MRLCLVSLISMNALIGVTAAHAETLPLPKATYSADVTITVGDHQSSGHVYIDGTKERRALNTGSPAEAVMIIRRDQGRFYILKQQRHVAIEMRTSTAAEAGQSGAPGANIDTLYGVDAVPEGREAVAGLETTKYHIQEETRPGFKLDAEVWSTDDGIIVRIVGKNPADEEAPPARVELSKIARGPQDPVLFEVPKDDEVISAGGEPESNKSGEPQPVGGESPVSR